MTSLSVKPLVDLAELTDPPFQEGQSDLVSTWSPAVDVYEVEPVLNGNHALLHTRNVICTPHLGYVEKDTYETLYNAAIEQILSFAAGKPINVVNP